MDGYGMYLSSAGQPPSDTKCAVAALVTLRTINGMKWYDRAKARMEELEITQQKLADKLGMTRGGVGHYLSGRREPSLDDLIIIAKELRMTLDELAGDGRASAVAEDAPHYLPPKQKALIDMFYGLTKDQQKDFMRSLETTKQQNDLIYWELKRRKNKDAG